MKQKPSTANASEITNFQTDIRALSSTPSSNSFTEDTSISLPGVLCSSVAWSDYTGDGKPDFLLTGQGNSGLISKLYKNTSPTIINGTADNDILIGTANSDIINGLAGNDKLSGLAGNDSLNGGDGVDTLDGGAGSDQLKGGTGNDTYVVDNAGDIVTELASGGTDLIQSSVTYTLPVEVENLTLTGITAINGTGNTLANIITGNTANNILNGSTGADQLTGGTGNDTYIVDNAGDIVTELASGGTDLIQSSVTYTLPVEVENLTLTGTTAINGTGNTLANILTGNTANNILNGSTGNDTYVVDNAGDIVTELASAGTDLIQSSVTYTLPVEVENLTLTGTTAINGTGNALANTIIGNTANNTLNGGAGKDILTGGVGADTYRFQFGQSSVSAPDRVTDFAIGSDKIDLLTQAGAAMNAPTSFSRAANSTATTLQNVVTQVFTDANGALASNQALGINSAALVVVTTAGIAGTYLVVNDGVAGFLAGNDLVINLTGYTGALPALGNLTVSSFFI